MGKTVIIPAQIVSVVRAAVLAELGASTEAIEQLSYEGETEGQPKGWAEALEHFDKLRALLEAIGWRDIDRAIDVQAYRRVLRRALEVRLGADRDFIEDGATSPESRASTERDVNDVEAFMRATGLKRSKR